MLQCSSNNLEQTFTKQKNIDMEFFLDSADFNEIEEALKLGFIDGITTTPTFMYRSGIQDIDGAIVKLSNMVPVLMIEALGETSEEIIKEAKRLLALGLDKKKTVFKIPISMEGLRACKKLREENIMVNIHLVYNLQQALLALTAKANYICVLVGRMQDQGHDALALASDIIKAIDYYGYDAKMMFSSVRHPEHVRNAFNIGSHNITIPWKVMKQLADNNFSKLGTEEFFVHTRLLTMKAKDMLNGSNPIVHEDIKIVDALVKMTESGCGAVSVVDGNNKLKGVFTDGDLRRDLRVKGQDVLNTPIGELMTKNPHTIEKEMVLQNAVDIFNKTKVDNLVVLEDGCPVGMLDIQDLIKLNLVD